MSSKDLQPSELKVMNIIWDRHPIKASEIAALLIPETGWSKNTIYTLITRAVNKGFVKRSNPGFVCEPLVPREAIQTKENQTLLSRLYAGSAKSLFARMMGDGSFSREDLADIRKMLDEAEGDSDDS